MIVIRSKASGEFVCMEYDSDESLTTKRDFNGFGIKMQKMVTDDCVFHEQVVGNRFSTFSSAKYKKLRRRDCYIMVNSRGMVKKTCRLSGVKLKGTQFVPL